jgi:hypothetical protein
MLKSSQSNSTQIALALDQVPRVLYKSTIVRLFNYHKTQLNKKHLTQSFYTKHFSQDRIKKMTYSKTFFDDDVLTVLIGLRITPSELDKINKIQGSL